MIFLFVGPVDCWFEVVNHVVLLFKDQIGVVMISGGDTQEVDKHLWVGLFVVFVYFEEASEEFFECGVRLLHKLLMVEYLLSVDHLVILFEIDKKCDYSVKKSLSEFLDVLAAHRLLIEILLFQSSQFLRQTS